VTRHKGQGTRHKGQETRNKVEGTRGKAQGARDKEESSCGNLSIFKIQNLKSKVIESVMDYRAWTEKAA
jgi:hypothetical protein